MKIHGLEMSVEEANNIMLYGSKAAKYEVMSQMFLDTDEEFVKIFLESVGEQKFNELVVLA